MQETQTKKKHHFHMPSAFTILFLIIILIAILTWIIPAGHMKRISWEYYFWHI